MREVFPAPAGMNRFRNETRAVEDWAERLVRAGKASICYPKGISL